MEADARDTGLPPGSFDLVHARTLLITVPEPAEMLAEMVRLARPGGWVAGHSRRTIRADLIRALRPQILKMSLADERELDELDAAARHHLEDPDVVVMPSMMFLARGRKPASG